MLRYVHSVSTWFFLLGVRCGEARAVSSIFRRALRTLATRTRTDDDGRVLCYLLYCVLPLAVAVAATAVPLVPLPSMPGVPSPWPPYTLV